MRFYRKTSQRAGKPDMTPMIDVVFQLIAFFMLVFNFSKFDQSELINLPASELAKPPVAPPESPITLQLTSQGTVIFGGEESPLGVDAILWLRPRLSREADIIRHVDQRNVAESTIIIRADRDAKAGEVQELLQLCQERTIGFRKFKVRARQEDHSPTRG
jgi:biopolymer transport protein ExbD